MIILTQRLKKVAELIGKTEVLADIGCDHGHLPIHLLLKNLKNLKNLRLNTKLLKLKKSIMNK